MGKITPSTAETVLPVNSEKEIAPGDIVTISVLPQAPFRGEGLLVDPAIAEYFEIIRIAVGKDEQWIAPGPISAALFARRTCLKCDESFGPTIAPVWKTCMVGMAIQVQVKNISRQWRAFKAVIPGIFIV